MFNHLRLFQGQFVSDPYALKACVMIYDRGVSLGTKTPDCSPDPYWVDHHETQRSKYAQAQGNPHVTIKALGTRIDDKTPLTW